MNFVRARECGISCKASVQVLKTKYEVRHSE